MNTKFIPNEECLLCGSPGEARDVVRNFLTKYNIRVQEIPSNRKDKEEMGCGVVRLDISNVPRRARVEIIKMAS